VYHRGKVEKMTQRFELGRLAGLRLSAGPSAIVGSAILWVLLSGVAVLALALPPGVAIAGVLVAVLLHWASDIVYQLGHACAAQATRHPMIGIRLWWLLSTAVYPRDEEPLRAALHMRRALGCVRHRRAVCHCPVSKKNSTAGTTRMPMREE
jgi:hypothetical protein